MKSLLGLEGKEVDGVGELISPDYFSSPIKMCVPMCTLHAYVHVCVCMYEVLEIKTWVKTFME